MGAEFSQNGRIFRTLINGESAVIETKHWGTCDVQVDSNGFLLVPKVEKPGIVNKSFSVRSEYHQAQLLILGSGIVISAIVDPEKEVKS